MSIVFCLLRLYDLPYEWFMASNNYFTIPHFNISRFYILGNHEYRQLLATAKLELKKSKRKDYYKILGVDRSANEEEIKKGYRKRALVHHPGKKNDFLGEIKIRG